MGTNSVLDQLIARHHKIAKFLEDFREIQQGDAALAAEVLAALSDAAPRPGIIQKRGVTVDKLPYGARYSKVSAVFLANENKPMQAKDIADASGLKVVAIRDILYKAHAESFEKLDMPGHGVKKLFRLTRDAFDAAKSKG